MNKKDIGQRINQWLDEAPGQIFKKGKWKFWFPLVIGLTLLNGILTGLIFGFAGAYVWIGIIVGTMGALLCWLELGNLHYSDSEDQRLARVVSFLDSAALIFVIAHACFLIWAFTHLMMLRSEEAKYETRAESFNVKAERVQDGNVKIAEAGVKIAEAGVKAERIRNNTARQLRRAAESGARVSIQNQSSGALFPAISTAPVEMERPKAPAESSTAFLAKWDKWIRITNFGELVLAAITLIYIRNRSARFNAQGAPEPVATSHRGLAPSAALRANSTQKKTPVATDWREEALLALRDHLGVIAEGLPNRSFKADLRKDEGVWIRLYESRRGRETMIAKTCQSDKLLAAVNRPDFRGRLIDELIHRGFPIGGER